MKKLALILAVFLAIAAVPNVLGTFDWTGTSINSGYAVTTDWHGEMVPYGEEVTAWAGTTNMDIEKVVFRWLRPDGTSAWNDTDDSGDLVSWEGKQILEFNATRTLDEIGDWGVQAIFYDDGGHGWGPYPSEKEKVAIRARSFFQIPEVAIGTIAILIALFGALGAFVIVKRKTAIPKSL